jgi:hypothetical protein
MRKELRNRLIAVITLIYGLVFLYQPHDLLVIGITLPLFAIFRILEAMPSLQFLYQVLQPLYQPDSILLKGIAFPLLVTSAVVSQISFSNKRITEVVAVFGLIAGVSFLYLPAIPTLQALPVSSILRGSAFHMLFASGLAFGMTTNLKRSMEFVAGLVVVAGLAFLYQPFNPLLQGTGLHWLLTGMIVLATVSPRKLAIERISISAIAFGLVFLCQPFLLLLYQTGFHILLGGLTGFIVVAHR